MSRAMLHSMIRALSLALTALWPSIAWTAAFLPEIAAPLTPAEVAKLGGRQVGNKIYIGDQVFRSDQEGVLGALIRLWTNGVFVFEFDPAIEEANRTLFRDACNVWAESGVIVCRERTNQGNYVYVSQHTGLGCDSPVSQAVSCSRVGMVGGKQDLEVYVGSWTTPYILQHEIGHALGFIHEHQRNDRDDHIIVQLNNVASYNQDQFSRWDSVTASTEYDYESIMHYPNCLFSIHGSTCHQEPGDNTPDLQSMVPRACARDFVGGRTISALDREALRAAYAPRLMALFPTSRRLACGVHQLSVKQANALCGTNCLAGPARWTRVVQETRGPWCGFAPNQDPVGYCTSRGQEFRRDWWDQDEWAGECWGGTRIEYWLECGCSQQAVPATCKNLTGKIDAAQLLKLLSSNDPRDKNSGLLITKLVTWVGEGKAQNAVLSLVGELVLRNYGGDNLAKIADILLCDLVVFVAVRSKLDSGFVLTSADFEAFARRSGFRL